MKHNKLLTLSLLASFLILISASYSFAQPTLTYGTIDVCPQPQGSKVYVPVIIDNPSTTLSAIDLVGKTVPGVAILVVTGVSFDDRMLLSDVLDQRYPLTFLGGGEFRFGAVKLNFNDLAAGTGQVATLELEFISDCLEGTTTIVEASAGGYYTAFVDDGANLILPTVFPGAVNVVNSDPYFTVCPGDTSVYWGLPGLSLQTQAEDLDIINGCGCDAIAYNVTAGPGSVNSSGLYQLVAGTGIIGCNTVEITVSDNYGGVAICTFDVDVLNHPPEFTVCPGESHAVWDMEFTSQVVAIDPDNGPTTPVVYSLDVANSTVFGNFTVHPDGSITWTIPEDQDYLGDFVATIIATDNANLDACNTQNADTCVMTIHVSGFMVTIEKLHGSTDNPGDTLGVLQGHFATVSVYLDSMFMGNNYLSPADHLGGYDLLIAYDPTALTFTEAAMGDLLDAKNWEFFTYRHGPFGNCGNACPSGMIRLVALAETNDGPHHPDPVDFPGELAKLTFLVTNDRTFECMFAPIQFFWIDCGDNGLASFDGQWLFVGNSVYSFEHVPIGVDPAFPGYGGVTEDCYDTIPDTDAGLKNYPLRAVGYRNGGIDIICSDDIDAPGDINLNGLSYEISDAVMFTNYFIAGLVAFEPHIEGSIAASDVNKDGTTLSVADLVYLIRVIQGDALPYPKLSHGSDNLDIATRFDGNEIAISYDASTEIGAVLLTFEFDGTIGQPVLGSGASNMEFAYGVSGNELRVLVYSYGDGAIQSGDNQTLLTIPVQGSINLIEGGIEAADFFGNTMNATSRVLPSRFDLAQNYPNPFNPSTSIALSLPVASDYSVKIYNIAGQLTRSYSGAAEAGIVEVVWDGKDSYGNQVASGMYFYKATASNFSATKKMVLMK